MAELNLSALGEAIDTSWGRSSSPVTSGFSVKMNVSGHYQLNLTYQTIVNFGTEREMLATKRLEEEQASKNIKSIIDNVKKNYKELSGSALKLKETSSSDSVEIVGMNVHNPKRTALYRRKCTFEVA